jgi:regulator of sigma E protease
MHQFLVSTVAFIVLVGVMVIIHELGHFIVAKLCGVRVEAFSFGFGPRLFGFKYGETDYKVCLLPLGGFVKMTGETPGGNLELPDGSEAPPSADDPGAFTSHPRWQRILIGLAGPTANFVLALVLMLIYFGFFNEVPSVTVNSTAVEWVTPDSAAAQAGLEPGDVIRSFDGATNPNWDQVYAHLKLNANQNVKLTVERSGQAVPLTLHVPAAAKNDDFDPSDAGLLPEFMPGPIQVTEVQPGSPAQRAGLRAGDQIESVDGHPFHSVTTLLAYMQAEHGKPMDLEVERNGSTISMHATPEPVDSGYRLGFTYQPPPLRNQPLAFVAAWKKSVAFCNENSLLVFEVLERLFTHKFSVSQLMGPVGIARVAGEAAETHGWLPKFGLAGEISINLGILNLLPFPILDGGLILLLIIESIMRHDISVNVKERIYQAAFVVLMVFFVFIIFNDVSKLPMFTHARP